MTFTINKILHASFLVGDIETSLKFYRDLLGMDIDHSRPDLGYPGVWLNVGYQQLHLLQLPNPDPNQRPHHGGHDRHVALQVNRPDQLKQRLERAGINYTTSKSRKNVVFVRDPDGNTLELIGE